MNLETWLKQENILSCLDGLKAAGVTEPHELCELTEEDLEAMLGWNMLTRRRVISAISKLNGMNLEPSILEIAKRRIPSDEVIKPGVRSKISSPRLKPASPHYRGKTKSPITEPRRKHRKGRSRSMNSLPFMSLNADDWGRLSDKTVTSVRTLRARGGSQTREKRRKVTKFLPNGQTVTEWSTPRRNSGEEEKPHSDVMKTAASSKVPAKGTVLGSLMSSPGGISKKSKTARYSDRQKSRRTSRNPFWQKSTPSLRSYNRAQVREQLRREHSAHSDRRGGIAKFHAKAQNEYYSDGSSGEHNNGQGFWRDWSDDTGSPAYNESAWPSIPPDHMLDSPSMPPMNINPAGHGLIEDLGTDDVSSEESENNRLSIPHKKQNISFIPEDIPLTPCGNGLPNDSSLRRRAKSKKKSMRQKSNRTLVAENHYGDEVGSASPPLPNVSNVHKRGMQKKGETSSVCFFRTDSIKLTKPRSMSVGALKKEIRRNKVPAATSSNNLNIRQKHNKSKHSNYEISGSFDQEFSKNKKKGTQWGDDGSLSSFALLRKPAEWVYSTSTMDSIPPLLDKKALKGGKEITEFGNAQFFQDEQLGSTHSDRVCLTEKKEHENSKEDSESQNPEFFQNDLFNPWQNLRVIPYLPSLTGIEDVVLTINKRLFDCQVPTLVSKVQPQIAVVVNLVKKMATSLLADLEGREEINMRNKFTEANNIILTFKKEISLKHRRFEELLQSLLMETNPFGDLDVLLIEQRKLTEIVAENENLIEGNQNSIKSREKSKLLVETFGQQALLEIQRMPNPSKALKEMIAAVENYKKEEKAIESVKTALQKKKKLDRAISNSRRMEQYMENVMAQLRYNIQLIKACAEAIEPSFDPEQHKNHAVIGVLSGFSKVVDEKPKNNETYQKIPYTELPLRLNKPFEQTCKKIQRRCTGLSFMQLQYTFLMLKRHFMLLVRLYKTYTGLEGKNGQVFSGMSSTIWNLCCQSLQLPENIDTRQRNYQNEIFYQCSRTRTREKDSTLRYDDFIEAITQLAMHTSPEKEVWDAIEHLVMFHVIPKALDGWDVELPNRKLLAIFEEANNKAVLQRVFSHYCSYQDKEVQGKLLSFSKWEKMVYQKDEKVLSFMNWQKLCQDLTQVGLNYGTRFQQPTVQDQQFAFFTSKSLFPKRGCASYTDALSWDEFLDAVVRLAYKVVVIEAQKESVQVRGKTRILIRWLATIA